MKIPLILTFDYARKGEYEEPSICPLCKHTIKPQEIHNYTFKNNKGDWFLSFMYLCGHCYRTFVVLHQCTLNRASELKYTATIDYIGPSLFAEEPFDESIKALSPQFAKIYNQALAAENYKLEEIAGLGYRKALEFLVKDYCIHKYPDKNDIIKSASLGTCINNYISNPEIKMLSSRTAWLGNDEAHYIRKHEDRNINDMKKFVKAMVHFVCMDLIVEDAASISPSGSSPKEN